MLLLAVAICFDSPAMAIKFYGYDKCGTCRKAAQFLAARGIAAPMLPIREQPPTRKELETMLASYNGDIRRLFNTSGQDYRALKLSEKLPALSRADALALLASNGNLVKRPFVLRDGKGIVGFNDHAWQEFLA